VKMPSTRLIIGDPTTHLEDSESSTAEMARLTSSKTIEIREDALQVAARLAASLTEAERVVLVTSCGDRDGTPELAAHLAFGLARVSRALVALVDGRIRNPSLDQTFGGIEGPGFCELAEESANISDVMWDVGDGVTFIPAGRSTSPLAAPGCGRVIATLRERFRFVVIASGPVLSHPESVTFVSQSDGVVLSLRAGLWRRGEVEIVQRELARMRRRLLGVVLRD